MTMRSGREADRSPLFSGEIQKSCTPTPPYVFIGKGKAIPLQTWTDPEGSRRLRLSDFKTIGT